MSHHRLALAALTLGLLFGAEARAETLLHDSFDDGVLATNTNGVGGGFAPAEGLTYQGGYLSVSAADSTGAPYNVSYTEAGGAATIAGQHVAWQIQSTATFNPTNTKLTWNILTTTDPASETTDNHVTIGFAVPGSLNTPIALELRQDRLVFDMMAVGPHNYAAGRYVSIGAGSNVEGAVYGGAVDGMVASIELWDTFWRIDVTGTGIAVHQTGAYSAGHSVADVIAAYEGSPFAVFALMGQNFSHDAVTASFGSATLSTVPEPSTIALAGSAAVVALARLRARRAA